MNHSTFPILLAAALLALAAALPQAYAAPSASLDTLERAVRPLAEIADECCNYAQRAELDAAKSTGLGDDFRREARELIAHYKKTGDARYATPKHHITMLHLASIYYRLDLVQELLAAGADPNALMKRFHSYGFEPEPDTPLSAALQYSALSPQKRKADFLRLAQLLKAGGAELNHEATESLLYLAPERFNVTVNGERVSDGEDIVLGLMDMGVRAHKFQLNTMVEAGYMRAFTRILAGLTPQEVMECLQEGGVLNECAMPFFRPYSEKGERQLCLDMATLLLKGVDLRRLDAQCGQEVFERVADNLPEWTDKDSRELVDDFLALLIRHGADPMHPCEYLEHARAADYIAADAPICRMLAEKHGIRIAAPAHELKAATLLKQLEEIPVAAFRAEETKAAWDMLASLITAPTKAQLAEPERHLVASARALQLLLCADRERALRLLLEAPTLQKAAAWKGSALTASRHLLHNLLAARGTHVLPAESVEQCARGMLKQGRVDVAHALIGLLEFDADAAPVLERLSAAGTPPALRAAAMGCLLRLKGLPDLAALHEDSRHGKPDSSFEGIKDAVKPVRRALCSAPWKELDAPEPERLFYTGGHRASAQAAMALRELGAPLAAAHCLTGKGDPAHASFELEIALAQYTLAHEEDMRNPYLPCDCEVVIPEIEEAGDDEEAGDEEEAEWESDEEEEEEGEVLEEDMEEEPEE